MSPRSIRCGALLCAALLTSCSSPAPSPGAARPVPRSRTPALSGIVVDASGRPVGRAIVAAVAPGSARPAATTRTAVAGRFGALHAMREVGQDQAGEAAMTRPAALSLRFDAVIHVEQAAPARPRSDAISIPATDRGLLRKHAEANHDKPRTGRGGRPVRVSRRELRAAANGRAQGE